MNKFKKIGLTALAGSLVATSAKLVKCQYLVVLVLVFETLTGAAKLLVNLGQWEIS